jgi:cell division transport system permease protein
MLKKWSKKKVGLHQLAMMNSFGWMLERPLSSVMTVIVIAIVLALPGSFWIISTNLKHIANDWNQSGHISLYLNANLSQDKLNSALAEVSLVPGVGKASLISSEEGMALMQLQEGMHDIMRYLPDNPLPAVIDVTPSKDVNTPKEMARLYKKLDALPSVLEAQMDMDWLTKLHSLILFVRSIGNTLLVILGIAVMVIIGNTLRLTIQSHKEEVEVLKLVGATDSFIMRPFLYAGLAYAVLGGLIAVVIVNLFTLKISHGVNTLAKIYDMHFPVNGLNIIQVLIILGFAAILGLVGAMLSIKRQLAHIEPYH